MDRPLLSMILASVCLSSTPALADILITSPLMESSARSDALGVGAMAAPNRSTSEPVIGVASGVARQTTFGLNATSLNGEIDVERDEFSSTTDISGSELGFFGNIAVNSQFSLSVFGSQTKSLVEASSDDYSYDSTSDLATMGIIGAIDLGRADFGLMVRRVEDRNEIDDVSDFSDEERNYSTTKEDGDYTHLAVGFGFHPTSRSRITVAYTPRVVYDIDESTSSRTVSLATGQVESRNSSNNEDKKMNPETLALAGSVKPAGAAMRLMGGIERQFPHTQEEDDKFDNVIFDGITKVSAGIEAANSQGLIPRAMIQNSRFADIWEFREISGGFTYRFGRTSISAALGYVWSDESQDGIDYEWNHTRGNMGFGVQL